MSETQYYVPASTRSLVIPGLAADNTYTFKISAYRKVDADVDPSGVILSPVVTADPYKPVDNVEFDGDITGTIQGRDSLQVVLNLENIASDSVLSTAEKPSLILEHSRAQSQWNSLNTKATNLGTVETERSAAETEWNDLNAYLAGLSPAWDDTTVHTPIDKTAFQDAWASFYVAIADLQAVITGEPGADGADGADGMPAVSGYLTNENVTLFAYANGDVVSYDDAAGEFIVVSGSVDVTASFDISVAANPQTLGVAINGNAYSVSSGMSPNDDTASVTFVATGTGQYAGVSIVKIFTIAKAKGGYEIVSALPTTNLFVGRVVFKDTDEKLYRYVADDGTGNPGWTTAVAAADISGEITIDQLADGAVDATKLADGIEPVAIVTEVPGAKVTSVIFNEADGKTYRWDGAEYIATTDTSDLTGTISDAQIEAISSGKISGQISDAQIAALAAAKLTGQITGTQITDGAIDTPKLAAGAVTTDRLAANSVVASKLAVIPESILPDPYFYDQELWTSGGWDTDGWYFETDAFANNARMLGMPKAASLPTQSVALRRHMWGRHVPFAGDGQILRLRAKGVNPSNDDFHVTIRFYDYTQTGDGIGDLRITFPANSGVTTQTAQMVVPAGTREYQTLIYNEGAVPNSNYVTVGAVKLDVAASADLLVDGSIEAVKIKAGTISTDKLSVGVGSNMLEGAATGANPNTFMTQAWNPDSVPYETGPDSTWIQSPNYGFWSSSLDWTLSDNSTFAIHQSGAENGSYGFSYFGMRRFKDLAGNYTWDFNVEPGRTYEFSIYTGAHRCKIEVYIEFWNDSGNIISGITGTANNQEKSGGKKLSGYKRIYARGVAPSNAAFIRCFVKKWHTVSGQTDSWAFLAKPMLGETSPNATDMLPWNAPGGTIIQGDQIRTNTIHANRIAAGTISANEMGADSVTAGKVAAGAINTRELAAGAIKASKVAVNGENLWPDPQCQDIDWWKGPTQGTFTAAGYVNPTNDTNVAANGWTHYPDVGNLNFRVGGGRGYWQIWSGDAGTPGYSGTAIAQVVPPSLYAKPNTMYELGIGCTNSSNKNLVVNVQYFDNNGAQVGSANLLNWSAGDTTTIYYRTKFTTPSNCSTIRIYWEVQSGAAFSGYISVGNVSLREAAAGTMIVDGAIGANHVAANSITASKLFIGDTSNMLPDPTMTDLSVWEVSNGNLGTTPTGYVTPGQNRIYTYGATTGDQTVQTRVPVEGGKHYYFRGSIGPGDPVGTTMRIYVNWYAMDASGNLTYISGDVIVGPTAIASPMTGERIVQSPSNARLAVYVFHKVSGVSNTLTGFNAVMRRASAGEIIVDGAITAGKISANAVTADKIQAGAVTAAKINVNSLEAISATIGTLRTATSGARTEIKDNLIEVYHSNDQVAVQIGVF